MRAEMSCLDLALLCRDAVRCGADYDDFLKCIIERIEDEPTRIQVLELVTLWWDNDVGV